MSRSRRSMSAFSISPITRRPTRAIISTASARLATEIRDLYGYLIDGMQGTRGADPLRRRFRRRGDLGAEKPDAGAAGALFRRRQRRPRRQGARSTFDLPAFNGTVARDGGGLDARPSSVGAGRCDRARSRSWSRPACRASSRSTTIRDSICRSTMSKAPRAITRSSVDLHGAARRRRRRPASQDQARRRRAQASVTIPLTRDRDRRAPTSTSSSPARNSRRRRASRSRSSPGTQRSGRAQRPHACAGREPRSVERSARRFHPGDRRGLRRASRRSAGVDVAGAPARRSTLSLAARNRRQPRPALALCEQARQARSARDRPDVAARVDDAIAARAVAPGFERRLRPVVGQTTPTTCGSRLRHRFPDPRARKQICRAAESDGLRRSTGCAIPSSTPPTSKRRPRRARSPMRSMFWRATAAR